MANKKNGRRRKQGLFSKATNAGLVLLGLARPLQILFGNAPLDDKIRVITDEATFGMLSGQFNLQKGLRMYGPPIAAAGIGKAKQYLMRHFPVR